MRWLSVGYRAMRAISSPRYRRRTLRRLSRQHAASYLRQASRAHARAQATIPTRRPRWRRWPF